MQDVVYALRSLRRSPGFTAVAVLTLALGIGANTTIFAALKAMVFDPFMFHHSDRMVFLFSENTRQGHDRSPASAADFLDWRDQSTVFDSLAAYRRRSYRLGGVQEPERVRGTLVTGGFFAILGAQPALGRSFLPEEYQIGHQSVVILSDAFWRRKLAADPGVIGREMRLDDATFTVAGVMPPAVWFPARNVDFWTPLPLDPAVARRETRRLSVIGMLRRGVTLDQARAEVGILAKRLESEYPQTNAGWSASVFRPYDAWISPEDRLAIPLLSCIVAAVLLIACSNAANLCLARAISRRREIAVRRALGAGVWRLAAQGLVENSLLALLAGGLGLLVAAWSADVLVAAFSFSAPVPERLIDLRVVVFTFAVSALSVLIFGLSPALEAVKTDIYESLKEGGARLAGSLRAQRLGRGFVVAQVAVAVILLTVTGLLAKAIYAYHEADRGFRRDNVLALRMNLASWKYPGESQVRSFYAQALDRLRNLPGVEAVAAISELPVDDEGIPATLTIEGKPPSSPADRPMAQQLAVTPGYFRTLSIPVLRGRDIGDQDQAGGLPVAVINQTMASRFWPGLEGAPDSIGKRFRIEKGDLPTPWITVVGVVRDVKPPNPVQRPKPQFYLPHAQSPSSSMGLVARVNDTSSTAVAAREVIRSLDKDEPVDITTIEQAIYTDLRGSRSFITLLGILAGLALTLAAIGLFGVISYNVSQRVHEIGVRIALGAGSGDVVRLVMTRGLQLTGLGLAIGVVASLALTRLLRGLLLDVTATDPVVISGVCALLLAVAAAASYLPARRAARVDPMVALRYE